MRKLEDILLYSDDAFYSAFPSIICRQDGELLVAFRRAPDRRRYFAKGCTHSDPNSYLVLVRSRNVGKSWSTDPELVYAHPGGGSQDPCMVQLNDGSLLITSYAWMVLPEEGIKHASESVRKQPYGWAFTFLGGYLMRSCDGGLSWEGPILPPQLPEESPQFPGISVPAHNRGAMVQATGGHLYWISQCTPKRVKKRTELDLVVSEDRGLTWRHGGKVAQDSRVSFNETSLIETKNGDLVAFVRTDNFNDHGVVVRSKDKGKTWESWEDTGIIGHPYHAVLLPDGRVYLVYGYRHEPYGIRARILDSECTDFSGEELVLRDDGGTSDLGYPWSCVTADGRILTVYYFNKEDGTRHIAGTFVDIS